MAISSTVNLETGITVSDCYIRLVSISVENNGSDGGSATALLHFFADRAKPPFASRSVSFLYNLEGENPIKQAYEHLKTLPEFEGAIDC